MNTGNTYYFIDDFNKICKCENGMKSDESIVLETYELVDDVNRLVEENEQLKKQMQRLYNYFVDWHGDIMGANQFSEMWDDVKEDEDWED